MKEYIDKETLLNEVGSRIMWSLSYNAIYEAIQEAPAANVVEVRRGHWIDGADQFGAKRGEYRVCSFCNLCIPNVKEVPSQHWQCCPSCMTIMREVDHAET